MKILSLNLHCFKEEDRIAKLDRIIDFIKEHDIDVCMFQEAAQDVNEKYINESIREGNNTYYISSKLNYNIYYHYIKHSFGHLEEGLAIISKYPIKNPNFKIISKTKDTEHWYKRDCIVATINDITFLNTHLGWDDFGEVGMEQIKEMLELVDDNNLTILAGDMNFADGSDEINYIKKHMYSCAQLCGIDPKLNPTFHYDLDSKMKYGNNMIDFIFINKKMDNIKYEIVFNKEEDYVSDHSAIYVQI